MITVMGATGHTGRKVTEMLLQAGERVRALGRSETRLSELERAGAEVLAGDAGDAAFLTRAFRGADAVFTMLPPDFRQPTTAPHRIASAPQSRPPFATAASGGRGPQQSRRGTHRRHRADPHLHDFEQRLQQLEHVDVLLLRPAYFFENFEESLDLIKHQGIHANAVDADVRCR